MRNVAGLLLLLGTAAQAQDPELQVAITFDDLPTVSVAQCAPMALNQRLLAVLERERIPAAALVVTGSGRCGAAELPAILEAWVARGHEIGSHSHRHRDANDLTLAAYLADMDSAHARLTAILRGHDAPVRYFRHPFLHAGNTAAKKDGIERKMRSKGYRNAVVTVDNQEWVFAAAYAAAKRRGDRALVYRIVPAYTAHIDTSFGYYEQLSQRLFQRQIPQVLLLHANELNADHLGDVVRAIRARGYRFVSLRSALQDSAYRRPDTYVGPAGMSWLQRWALAEGVRFVPEPREPAWLGR